MRKRFLTKVSTKSIRWLTRILAMLLAAIFLYLFLSPWTVPGAEKLRLYSVISGVASAYLLIVLLLSLLNNLVVTAVSPLPQFSVPAIDVKPLFDHIRNFGISAAVFIGGFTLFFHKANLDSLQRFGAAVLMIIGIFLVLINIVDGALKIMRQFQHTFGVKLLVVSYLALVRGGPAGGTSLSESLGSLTKQIGDVVIGDKAAATATVK